MTKRISNRGVNKISYQFLNMIIHYLRSTVQQVVAYNIDLEKSGKKKMKKMYVYLANEYGDD